MRIVRGAVVIGERPSVRVDPSRKVSDQRRGSPNSPRAPGRSLRVDSRLLDPDGRSGNIVKVLSLEFQGRHMLSDPPQIHDADLIDWVRLEGIT